jgi:hypothetical protein
VAVLVVAAVIVGMLFVLFAVVRFAWDFLHDEVPMEGGGSMGRQMFGHRQRAQRPEDWLKE